MFLRDGSLFDLDQGGGAKEGSAVIMEPGSHYGSQTPVPIESGLTSAPRFPQTLQVKRSSISDSLTASGEASPLIATEGLHR